MSQHSSLEFPPQIVSSIAGPELKVIYDVDEVSAVVLANISLLLPVYEDGDGDVCISESYIGPYSLPSQLADEVKVQPGAGRLGCHYVSREGSKERVEERFRKLILGTWEAANWRELKAIVQTVQYQVKEVLESNYITHNQVEALKKDLPENETIKIAT
jgi:hypothetical protein